jgi:hypothetical protein
VGRAEVGYIALVVAAQDWAAEALCQEPAFARVGSAIDDITRDDDSVDVLSGEVVEGCLECGEIAVNVGEDCETHAIAS